jgi:hypothetical protein
MIRTTVDMTVSFGMLKILPLYIVCMYMHFFDKDAGNLLFFFKYRNIAG